MAMILPVLLLFFFPLIATAETTDPLNRILVTATRLSTKPDHVSGSVSVISAEELDKRKADSLAEVLEALPGVHIVRSGGPGSPTSAMLRGAGGEHTLVLIDGVRMNDPMSPSRSFDFGTLTLEGIERIEIIRGPESVLYGSDAVGGVIHIITKSGSAKSTGKIGVGYGNYQTLEGWAGSSGTTADTRYSLSGRFEKSGGYSAANVLHGNLEPDGRTAASAHARFDFKPIESLPSVFRIQYSDSKFDNDSSGGPGGDDPDYKSTERKVSGGFSLRSHHSEVWEPLASVSYSYSRRTAQKDPNPAHDALLDTEYQSRRLGAELQNNLFLNEKNTLIFGTAWERESGEAREDLGFMTSELNGLGASSIGFFVQHQLASDGFFGTAGARFDLHERFGSRGTYRLAPGYSIAQTGTRFRASFGTAFKAPSLYQLYSSFGDPHLQPELSAAYDLSVDQKLADGKLQMTLTYFHASLKNLTEFEPILNRFQNLGSATTEGLETSITAEFRPELTSTLTYTFTNTRDGKTGLPLYRRPAHQGSIEASYEHLGVDTGVSIRIVGSRDDIDATTFTRKLMPAYWLMNLRAAYSLPGADHESRSKVMLKLENLLDRHYEEVDGYGTPGRSLHVAFERGF